jgi:hypothetical protein
MFDKPEEANAKLKELEALAKSLGYDRTAASVASLREAGATRPMAAFESTEGQG